MAGIYVHIPFCTKKCFYCDFFKTTRLREKPLFLQALNREIELTENYLQGKAVETIYFGGGTPSVLTAGEAGRILEKIAQRHRLTETAEITIEANPDDLDKEYLQSLVAGGFNRISIGIQTFSDDSLKKLNRRHNSAQAIQSVSDAAASGFRHISADLIYGLPGLNAGQWEENLGKAISLPIDHLSAYHLTYHEGTMFHRWLLAGKITEIPEEESIRQYEMLIRITEEGGFEQYEISNFARNKAYSRHNCSYWESKNYLGLGPSAHSYNGQSRQWNVPDMKGYINSVMEGKPATETEILTETDKLNDYLITRIRTKWGISTGYIESVFGAAMVDRINHAAEKYLQTGLLERAGETIVLTPQGVMVSDRIMTDLYILNQSAAAGE